MHTTHPLLMRVVAAVPFKMSVPERRCSCARLYWANCVLFPTRNLKFTTKVLKCLDQWIAVVALSTKGSKASVA